MKLTVALLLLAAAAPVRAHVGEHPSVHDTVAGVIERMRRAIPHSQVKGLTLEDAEAFLSVAERHILATEHFSFSVNVPVTVFVLRDLAFGADPFWLQERAFELTPLRMKVDTVEFDVWKKDFPAGRIGLGVNSLAGGGDHYLVAIAPKNPADALQVTDLYPGQGRAAKLVLNEKAYVDRDELITAVPPELDGMLFLQTAREWNDDGQILNILRFTEHVSSSRPDHVTLTWSGDPRTTQSIQWRTGPKVRTGVVAYQKKAEHASFRKTSPRQARAKTITIEAPNVVNDPVSSWHTVELTGLEPDTTYVYSVGTGRKDGWSELAEFTTAPARTRPFSFVYMGDAQNGLDRWGSLVRRAFRERSDAAFYVMAGDLVNRGAERDDWDSLFFNAAGIYDRRQLVPAIGNHECQGGQPTLYLKHFNLPKNGPAGIEPERAYAFEYSNALFVILDSNLPPEKQTSWLEAQLAGTKAVWKFAVYHHPAYSSAVKRDNQALRDAWGPIFDKYHVDLALQGHDHAYLRTYPMKAGQRAASAKEGTIYIVSVSGTKMYEQDPRDYTEFGMTKVSTYQVLDIQISGDRLVYRAYDEDGKLRDEFVIAK